MRLAELNKLREDLSSRHKAAAPSIESFRIKNLSGFADCVINPKGGFLVICGGTGVGKTTLLELLYSSLRGEDDPAPRNMSRLSGAFAEVNVAFPAEMKGNYRGIFTLDQAPAGVQTGVRFVGLEARTAEIQFALADEDFDVLKEGAGRKFFDRSLVDLVSLVCSKSYDRISFYETEIGDRNVPIFEVEMDGLIYNSNSMATGELSVFYLAWVISTAPPYSILIIEEPEAHLPPLSHFAIFGLLARYTLKLKLCLVISTHSPTIASEVPDRSLVSIRRAGRQSILPVGIESKTKILARLGLQPRRQAVLFVEDNLARDVLYELIAEHEINSACFVEIHVCINGAGEIKTRLENIPSGLTSISFVGVLDGDMRQKSASWKTANPIVFLPFVKEMEVEFLDSAESSLANFAKRIGRKVDNLEYSLSSTQGQNYHDRYKNVSYKLRMDEIAFTNHALKH